MAKTAGTPGPSPLRFSAMSSVPDRRAGSLACRTFRSGMVRARPESFPSELFGGKLGRGCGALKGWPRVLPFFLFFLVGRLFGAEVMPPTPRDHFNDYAGMVSPAVRTRLNEALVQFERNTSNQIVVAIYPTMQSDSSIEDYTVRVAQAWGVGQKDRKNGAVLFVFQQDRTIFLQVGYGLEGVLPDARAKQIIENEITPRFRNGDFEGGITAGVEAVLASIRGEYTGTGRTVKETQGSGQGGGISGWVMVGVFILVVLRSAFGSRRNTLYSRGGRRGMWMPPPGRGGWGGGSGGGRSGGSFSGGGGSFGGGGAGGRW